jgi:hypothetical protein
MLVAILLARDKQGEQLITTGERKKRKMLFFEKKIIS